MGPRQGTRRILGWGTACALGVLAACSSSSTNPSDAGGDDGTSADAASGVDATHEAAADAHADAAPADATNEGAAGDGAAEGSAKDAANDGEGDSAGDSAGDSPAETASDAPSDAPDASEAGPATCYAIHVDQTTANVSAPSTGWGLGNGDWTLEAWVKAHDEFVGGVILSLNEATLAGDVQLAYDSSSGEVLCTTYSGSCPCGKGSGNLSLGAGNLHDHAWHHVACVNEGGVGKLYIDGVESDTDNQGTSLTASSDVGVGQPSGDTSLAAAPVVLGPTRFSNLARYVTTFTPATTWAVDSHTITQYLVADPFGTALVDEAGGDNTSTSATGVSASSDTPCSPATDGGAPGDAGDAGSVDAGDAADASDSG